MTKTEIIDSLLEQARDKLSFVDGDEDDVFTNDVRALVEASQLLMVAVNAEHARWESVDTSSGFTHGRCSKCGKPAVWEPYEPMPLFCRNCYAKMDGVDGND